jgi:preprotein translocase subunit YajC
LAFPVIAIGFLFYFMLIRPEKQKQSRHREMLSNLKKNDRVVTVGGIRGVISNVQRDQDEVTVNIDESTGTKIRVSLSSIVSIAGQGDENDNKKK